MQLWIWNCNRVAGWFHPRPSRKQCHCTLCDHSSISQKLLRKNAFTHWHFYTQNLLHADAFTHWGFCTQTLLHTDAFTQKPFYKKQMRLHTDALTHRGFYIQKLLHTDPFTHKSFYTHKLQDTDAFTHRCFHTQKRLRRDTFTHLETPRRETMKWDEMRIHVSSCWVFGFAQLPYWDYCRSHTLLHADPFTHRRFYTQMLLHTDAFTRKPFYTQKLSPQFLTLDHHFASVFDTRPSFRAKGLRANLQNRNLTTRLDIKTYESEQSAANAMLSYKKYHFTSVLHDRTSFRAKKLRRTRENRNFISVFGDRTSFRAKGLSQHTPKSQLHLIFWWSKLVSCERVVTDASKSQFHLSFWRSKLVSCKRVAFRAVSLALPRALREK